MKRLLLRAAVVTTLLLVVPAMVFSVSPPYGNLFSTYRRMGVLLWPGAYFVFFVYGSHPFIVMVAVSFLFWFATALAALSLWAKFRAPANV